MSNYTQLFYMDVITYPCPGLLSVKQASEGRTAAAERTRHWKKIKHRKSSWWRHQMETFSALLAFCAGNSPVTGEFPTQRPVTRSFDVLFDLRLNKRLSKQSWGWWFETLSSPLWRHSNEMHRLERHRPPCYLSVARKIITRHHVWPHDHTIVKWNVHSFWISLKLQNTVQTVTIKT